ncbi:MULTISPECIES: hypothetical protein [unclassified Roseobacter]|uniref:hypothetical protein n=1 Tax=unclassified Roseobacter TaxID=196798 RepID=UPI00149264E1|nr:MULTISPECIES: hypothetical protein [unclassified Roseobacter]NNW55484.1 hypothetical protein [Roseobacter sp. HKCCD8284]NNY17329.1 hypothetical protein [Roseobacter sp. HKCCD8191]
MPQSKLKKHTLFLNAGDYDYLAEVGAASGKPAAQIIRELVTIYVNKLKDQEQIPDIKVNIND